jgi:DNA-binding XRE family transcriptional regulator
MSVGYVYVIGFSNGIVKVGRTQNITRRLRAHAMAAHNFGIAVTAKWVSPEHAGWIGNEDELIRLAHEAGGQPTTPEYFRSLNFETFIAIARQLPFAPDAVTPRRPALDGKAIQRARIEKFMEQAEVAEAVNELGVSFHRSGLSLIENGSVKRPSLKVVRALSQVLGIEPTDMFKPDGGEDEDEDPEAVVAA